MRFSYVMSLLALCCCIPGCDDLEPLVHNDLRMTTVTPTKGPLRAPDGGSRYFVDSSGQPVYLAGSHTHLNSQDRDGDENAFDYGRYLLFLQQRRHNFTKLWAWEDARHSPLPYRRVGLEMALDGKPKFDLTKWNQAYFDRLRTRVIAAGEQGIYVSVMLFNGWSVESKEPGRSIWRHHPFHRENNVNGIDGDPNGDGEGTEVHTLNIPAVTAIQEAYVNQVIESVHDLDNVLYEISNESAPTIANTAWQHHFINFIHRYEASKPRQHPVGMTVQWPNGSNQVLYESPADWISPNQTDGYDMNPPTARGDKVVLNDTDHLWGNGGSADWVWMSFTRGLNPIFMDETPPLSKQYALPQADDIRVAMGDTLEYAKRIDVGKTEPRPDLCSTSFCLVNPGRHYVIYFPPTRWCSIPVVGRFYKCNLTVDLSGVENSVTGEWFAPGSGKRQPLGTTAGGAVRTFIPPFPGASVLYLQAQRN